MRLCVDIGVHLIVDIDGPSPETMGRTFEILAQAGAIDDALAQRMIKAVGFRNIAVHNYEAIDWKIVYAICATRLNDFKAYAQAVAHWGSL